MRVWVNICASNNAWSSGVTPAHLAKFAAEKPVVPVFDLSDQALIGATAGDYDLRLDGAELWAALEVNRIPGGKWHGESLITKEADGSAVLRMVTLTTLPRGAVAALIAQRHPGRVGSL